MKTLFPILLISLCAVQVSPIAIQNSKPRVSQDELAPTDTVFRLHFNYPVWPLTNGFLESSTDLVTWQSRYDYDIVTNPDGTTDWDIHVDSSKPKEFFRAGGETIE